MKNNDLETTVQDGPSADEEEFRAMHGALHCEGCFYVDEEQLFRGPCCTHVRGPDTDDKGRCKRRKAKSRVSVGEDDGDDGLGACQGYGGGRHD